MAEISKGIWDKKCKCGHWFHEHYDMGLHREGCCFGDCLYQEEKANRQLFCKCSAFEEE